MEQGRPLRQVESLKVRRSCLHTGIRVYDPREPRPKGQCHHCGQFFNMKKKMVPVPNRKNKLIPHFYDPQLRRAA